MSERQRKTKTSVEGSVISIMLAPDSETPIEKNFDLASLSPEMINELATHGAKQKLCDSFSNVDLVHIAEAEGKLDKIWENLQNGLFNAKREGGGGPRVTQLAEALSRVAGRSIEECVEAITNMDDEQKKAIRASQQIKTAIAEIKLEKAQKEAEKANEGDDEGGLDVASVFGG